MQRPGRLSAATAALLACTALAPWFAPDARAQDAEALTPEQTTSLAHVLGIYDEATVTRLFGPGTDRVTPEGDHYVVKLPVDQGRPDSMVSGDDLTFHAKAVDGGRWNIDTLTLPTTLTIGTKGDNAPLKVELNTTGLDYQATLDPTNATGSKGDLLIDTMHAHVTGSIAPEAGKPPEPVDVAIGSGKVEDHGSTTAATAGRVDQATTFSLADLTVAIAGTKPFGIKAAKLGGDLKIGGMSLEQGRAFSAKVEQFQVEMKENVAAVAPAAPIAGVTPPAAPAKPSLSSAERATLKELLAMGRDLLTSLTLTEEADDISFAPADGPPVSMAKLMLSTDGSAPDGKLDAKETIAVDGLVVPGLPPGVISTLIPHRVVMAPHVTGISLDDVTTLLTQMIDNPDADPSSLAPTGMAMLAKGPIRVSMDQLAFDVGPATFEATGGYDIVSPSPTANSGTADLRATNLDDLMKVLATDETTKPGVAAIIFLKGIGKQDGNAVTWHVEYKDAHMLVNGTDMSQLIPQGN